jgi:hypothetical protein
MMKEISVAILLLNGAATMLMVGIIWFVQVVHYPCFNQVGSERFRHYQILNLSRTRWVVGPPMLIEAVTAALLVWQPPTAELKPYCWAAFFLLIFIGLSTAFLQMPGHQLLATQFDAAVHERLVRGNWLRTVAWTLRGLLVLFILHQCLTKGPLYGS